MRKILSLVALALTVAVLAPVAALADDSTATIQADIAQLQSDVKTKHDTVMADAQKAFWARADRFFAPLLR